MMGLINRCSFNFNENPAILTDGILWFKDLSSPDPTGILPILGGLISCMNMMSTNSSSGNSTMRKFSKYMKYMPLISIPIWMTFPAAFNIYWLVTASFQFAMLNSFRSEYVKKVLGIQKYLPGTKLERLNVK